MGKVYHGITCKGSYVLGAACGYCEKCRDERESWVISNKTMAPIIDTIAQVAESFVKIGLALPVLTLRHCEVDSLKMEMRNRPNECQIFHRDGQNEIWVHGCRVMERS